MFGGINGIGKFLGLLTQLVQKLLRFRKEQAAQKKYDASERDPAGAFIDRYGGHDDGVRPDKTDNPAPSETDTGERDQK